MTTPIHIDLNDLTDAHVEEALLHIGECLYAAPCIIGTLVPAALRDTLDGLPDTEIQFLVTEEGLVTMPDGQLELAQSLQEAFDTGRREEFLIQLDTVKRELAKAADKA